MRFSKLIVIIPFLLAAFFACKKNSDTFIANPNFYIVNGGTGAFDKNLILFSSADTIILNLVISSTYFLPNSTAVTMGVSDNYRDAYNIANQTSYKAMPSNAYSFETEFTADKGSVFDTVIVKIFKQYLQNDDYMLPVAIQNVSNYTIDTSASVIYLHTKNNELSGIYTASGVKFLYNGNASDSNLNSADSFSLPKNLIPDSEITSELDYADLGPNGWKYVLTFYDNGTFIVSPNLVISTSIEAGSFKVLSSSFDSTTKATYIKTSYKNTSGNERIIEESLNLQ